MHVTRSALPRLTLAIILALPIVAGGLVPRPGFYAVILRPGISIDRAAGELMHSRGWQIARIALARPMRIMVLRSPTGASMPAGLRQDAIFVAALPDGAGCRLPSERL